MTLKDNIETPDSHIANFLALNEEGKYWFPAHDEEIAKHLNAFAKTVREVERKRIEDLVEVVEIWSPTETDGQAITRDDKKLKRVAYLIGGVPAILEKDFVMERRHITKQEVDKLLPIIKGEK